ncbi:MAG: MlaE family ABC transporter permease [Planctomycetota bacterium]
MNFLRALGSSTVRPALDKAGYTVWLGTSTVGKTSHLFRRLRALLDQMYLTGVKSAPVVLFVGFFIGMIVALQVGLELARFGQEGTIGVLVAVTVTREMAPFVTAIILAASVGSAMAAELGTMKVQEEITALEILSVDVVSFLVLPRVLALTILAPILTLLADALGILGGSVIAVNQLGIDFGAYIRSAMDALQTTGATIPLPKDLYTGLFKATVFGFTIAVIGCARGLQTSGGARGVGETTRSAVRNSIVMIIILNFFIGKFVHS